MKINLCGNMGDPAAAFDLYEICEYFFLAINNHKCFFQNKLS